jgi:O-acetyl-ADP-ribose deacetylase (regulator of RNase III)
MIEIVKGDLLHAKERYIAHQTNCVTRFPHGLSEKIFAKYPNSDCYRKRRPIPGSIGKNCCRVEDQAVPGSIEICHNGDNNHIVINLFGQYLPGKSGKYTHCYRSDYPDSYSDRQRYFQQTLHAIETNPEINGPVAMPYLIGCGLAGGNWNDYRQMLEQSPHKFILYHLD